MTQTRRTIHGIPDWLWRKCKALAADKGVTLSEFVVEALREKWTRESGTDEDSKGKEENN